MAKMDASNQLVATLREWDVDTVFGLPGDGINGIIEAFRQCRDKIRFIQVRHEEAAAFMACAYAKAVYNQAVAHITFPVDLQVEPASPEERGVYGSADCTAGARTSRSGRLHVSPSPSGGVRLPQVQETLKNHVPVRDVQEENPNAQLFAAGADGTWTQQRRCPRSAGYGHAHNRAPRPRFHQNNG